ncbi:MAG: RsmB/NOP family class I SAM-dependent RNA methyltransferase, partial [Gemmobacter sp.]
MNRPQAATDGAIAARAAAARLIAGVIDAQRSLDDQIADPAGPISGLGPADRARAQRLASATLRRIGPAQAVLAPLLRRPPPVALQAILCLAVTELSDRPQDAHGIVAAAVDLARMLAPDAHAEGFVNAVLRRLATGADPLDGQPPQRLPGWLRDRLAAAWGGKAVAAMEAAHAAGAPLDLTPHRTAEAGALARVLGAARLPQGSLRLTAPGQVSALPGFAEGAWWVQDAAAAIPARLLAARPGEAVADLCAAPGGKTLQLAAAGARVTAIDLSPGRMARLAENLARCGLEAETVVADARSYAGGPFDAVLLDAPCTATGTIRRHPDLPFVKRPGDVAALAALQAAVIDQAVALTRPGGRMVYCTCSILPEEGEDQARAALARHPGLTLATADAGGLPKGARRPEGWIRLRPDMWADRGGIDGFFIALFHR